MDSNPTQLNLAYDSPRIDQNACPTLRPAFGGWIWLWIHDIEACFGFSSFLAAWAVQDTDAWLADSYNIAYHP